MYECVDLPINNQSNITTTYSATPVREQEVCESDVGGVVDSGRSRAVGSFVLKLLL